MEIAVNLMYDRPKRNGWQSKVKRRTLAACALGIAMPLALTGCGTLRQGNAISSQCEKLGQELAGAKLPQQRAETLEAGVELRCWKRSGL